MSREKHLYLLQDVKRIARALGYRHVWPVDREPDWERPVLAYLAAERVGAAKPFRESVFHSRWEVGDDVHSPEVLARLAVDCGVDPDAVARAPDADVVARAVNVLVRAWDDSVFGVPFFINGLDKFWGVDRIEGFVASLRGEPFRFGSTPPGRPNPAGDDVGSPEVRPDLPVYDTDSAGGCG
jgi:2-hydroxychromene-2-carboxylate isomerase